jgi:hypothetical protein
MPEIPAKIEALVRERSVDIERFEKFLPRLRDRVFVAALLEGLASNGGELSDGLLLEAASKTWRPTPRQTRETNQRRMLNLAKNALNMSTVAAAIGDFYGIEVGFSHVDAAKLHVQHIKGLKYKKTVYDTEGRAVEITVREKPSYEALRDYLKMTMPKEAKQINIDQRNLTLRANIGYAPPEIDATPIGDVMPITVGKK